MRLDIFLGFIRKTKRPEVAQFPAGVILKELPTTNRRLVADPKGDISFKGQRATMQELLNIFGEPVFLPQVGDRNTYLIKEAAGQGMMCDNCGAPLETGSRLKFNRRVTCDCQHCGTGYFLNS